MDYNLVVIGSGPGGYVAAIRASQLGMKTAVVERAEVGGICLNWGCIPTKALMKSLEVLETARSAAKFGVIVQDVKPDFQKIIQRSRQVARQVSKGVEYLFKKNNIELIQGHGKLLDQHTVQVQNGDQTTQITADYILLATGAKSRQLPNISIDGQKIWGYRHMLNPAFLPQRLVVIGSGATGVELGSFYAAMGSQVTIVEILPRVVPLMDAEISTEVEKILKRKKIKVLTNTKITKIDTSTDELVISYEQNGQLGQITADVAFLAVGIDPNTENLGLNNLGIKTDKKRILVNKFYQTNIQNIYAVGDIIPTPALAHVASAEGITAVEHMAGLNPKPIDYNKIPSGIFIEPQIANVGLTEEQAKNQGINYKTGKFPYSALGKATAYGSRDGFVKLIFDADNQQLIGAHIIGHNATDMISELVVAMQTNATAHQIAKSVHPHPTFSEAIMEAAEAALGKAIHI